MEGVAMRATLRSAGALLGTLVAVATASAIDNECTFPSYPYQGFRYYNGPFPYPGYRVVPGPIPTAPDMMNPGFYVLCPNNVWYGPNYCVTPPFPPFQGSLPGKQGQQIEAGRASCFSAPNGGPGGAGYAPYFPNYSKMAGYPGYAGRPAPTVNAFPTHPYARSPRDFFMWRENMEEQTARGSRPSFVP
jgi:hypothetical protein